MGMRIFRPYLLAAVTLLAAACRRAGANRRFGYSGPTGAISPQPPATPPPWSGQSGASGDPSMSAEAIRAAAADFHNCLERLWPLAARHGVSRQVYSAYTAGLTPDLRIMDLLDSQPEFTKSFWDYLDILVTDERIAQGGRCWRSTARPSMRSSGPMASTATSSPRSGAWRRITARRSATAR